MDPARGWCSVVPMADPCSNSAITKRAVRIWEAAGLDPIGVHESRHTCASVWIASGVNAKAITAFTGHANISTCTTSTGTSCQAARTRRRC